MSDINDDGSSVGFTVGSKVGIAVNSVDGLCVEVMDGLKEELIVSVTDGSTDGLMED